LHAIADTLADVQRRNFYRLTASVSHSGHYYHEHCTRIEVADCAADDEDTIAEALRDLMRWIYKSLEAEHDYLMSDECVDETIRANEYVFDENGSIA
jgi:tRNA A37 threonylcarbamoyladenosine dehydratase